MILNRIRKRLIKMLGGYTEQTVEVVETKTIRLCPGDIITIEGTQLFDYKRYEESEHYKNFAIESTIRTLTNKVNKYLTDNANIVTEVIPQMDAVRLKCTIKVVDKEW